MGIVDDLLAVPVRLAELHVDVRLLAKQLTAMEERMTAAESAAYDKLAADIAAIRDGWAAKDAEIAALRAALADAGADAEAKVAAALEADAAFDAVRITQADAALSSLLGSDPVAEP